MEWVNSSTAGSSAPLQRSTMNPADLERILRMAGELASDISSACTAQQGADEEELNKLIDDAMCGSVVQTQSREVFISASLPLQ